MTTDNTNKSTKPLDQLGKDILDEVLGDTLGVFKSPDSLKTMDGMLSTWLTGDVLNIKQVEEHK